MPGAELFHADENLRVAIHRNLVVAVWSDAPAPGQVTTFGRAILAVNARYRADFGAVSLVVAGTPRFGDDVRAELTKLLGDPRVAGRGTAHVVAMEGLAGVAVRAFLNTAFLVSRKQDTNRVFGSVGEGGRWLLERFADSKEPWTVPQIEEACAATR